MTIRIVKWVARIAGVVVGVFAFLVIVRLGSIFLEGRSVSGVAAVAYQSARACEMSSRFRHNTTLAQGGHLVCFRGEIDRASADEFIGTPIPVGGTVVLNSLGGDAFSAMDMAEYMLSKQVTVVVHNYCLSACANYLFMAGADKYVLNDSLLGFHGGPGTSRTHWSYTGPEDRREEVWAYTQQAINKLLERQAVFYTRIGVNVDVFQRAPPSVHVAEFDLRYSFWEYGSDSLRERFGVSGIKSFDNPDHKSFATKLLELLEGCRCKKVDPDAWFCTRTL